jgi:hypothetical protein
MEGGITVVDAGQVVASLELDASGFMDGINGAIRAARALSGGALAASGDIIGLSGAMRVLRGAAEDGARGAANALSGLRAVGAEAVNGLIAGALSRRGALVASFRALAGAAIRAARDELGIASPSKVFAEIGRYSVTGFVRGVDRGAEDARSAMRRLMDVGAAVPSVVRLSDSAAGGVTHNHYAAPVNVTFPGDIHVSSDAELRAFERRQMKYARDLQYGLGVRG